jgi:hypothetical protein
VRGPVGVVDQGLGAHREVRGTLHPLCCKVSPRRAPAENLPDPAGLAMAIVGLGNEGRIGFVAADVRSVAIARGQDSAPDPASSGVLPSPRRDRLGGRVRTPRLAILLTMAHIPVGWAIPPDDAFQACPTPPESDFVDKGGSCPRTWCSSWAVAEPPRDARPPHGAVASERRSGGHPRSSIGSGC